MVTPGSTGGVAWWFKSLSAPTGALKDCVRFVDFKTDQAEKDAYTDRYRFAGADRSKF